MKTLTSERLRLRPVTKRDFSAIAAMDSDPRVMRYLCLKSPVPSYEQAFEEVRSILDICAPSGGAKGFFSTPIFKGGRTVVGSLTLITSESFSSP